jgi:sulfite reductase (ferredoxin)
MVDEKKLAGQEAIKVESLYLKGVIAEELADDKPFVSDASYELLKFHGSYQGYDRDTATVRKKAGLDKEWEFMLRMVCPGGRLTSAQYLALDGISEQYANGTMRITTRETFQFHCIIKENLKPHIAAINKLLLTTLGGCGDVVRNVMCSPAPIKDEVHAQLLADTDRVAEFCKPKTASYSQLWSDGVDVKQTSVDGQVEPLYGITYLPRKFKIGLAVPEDNTISVMTHDLAVILIYKKGEFLGYNLCLGGGMGMTHNKAATYPRLATPMAFVGKDDLLRGVEATIKLVRDHGDRTNRKHARLKYVVEENGVEWTRKTLESYFGEKMADPKPMGDFIVPDHMGWHAQGDGKYFLGVPVSSGRIEDRDDTKMRSGLREVIQKFGMNVTLSADQNVILCDIEESQKAEIEAILRKHSIELREDITNIDRYAIACVALPTCGKALAEAERMRIPFIAEMEKTLEKHGIKDDRIFVSISGCPNGCSRPYVGDIGIVGRTPGNYSLYIGGDFEGTRLNTKVFDRVPYEHITTVFDILFAKYVTYRHTSTEGFGDYVHRVGAAALAQEVESLLISDF